MDCMELTRLHLEHRSSGWGRKKTSPGRANTNRHRFVLNIPQKVFITACQNLRNIFGEHFQESSSEGKEAQREE